jgi:GNAT superfamily N-acetyltransferase
MAADVPAMLNVFFQAMEDLDQRRRRPLQPREPRALEMHLGHLLRTDPRTCLVAEDRGAVVAFGVLMVREADAFLSFLFVLPAWQGRGLGRAIVEACLRAGSETKRRSTCAEADQPVSTGLYASLGFLPREPVYLLRGALDVRRLPGPVSGVRVHPAAGALPGVARELATFDQQVVGYARPEDHAFWTSGGRQGWFFEVDGRLRGYGYAHPGGRLGPLAADDPALLPIVLGHLARNVPVLEGHQAVVPGAAGSALLPLLAAGLRVDGTPAVYCTSGPEPRLDRYLPMSFALL